MKRNILLAIMLAAMMLLGTGLYSVDSHAVTPETGKVTVNYYYTIGGVQKGPADKSTVTDIYNYQGVLVYSFTGATFTVNLSYGNYTLKIHANFVVLAGTGNVTTNATSLQLVVNKATETDNINLAVQPTSDQPVTVNGLTKGTTAVVNFVDRMDHAYYSYTTNGTMFKASVPSVPFTLEVSYQNAYFLYSEAGGAAVTVSVVSGVSNIFGFVTSSNSSAISSVNIAVVNRTASSYVTVSYSSNQYNLFSNYWPDKTVLFESSGYAAYPVNSVTPGGLSPVLSPNSSPIYVNYTLSKDPRYLNATATFNFGNSTPVPLLPNSAVGSLYWQIQFDGITSAVMQNYMNSFFLNYTNSTIFVGGNNYNITGMKVVSPATVTPTGTAKITGEVSVTYYNSAIKLSVYKAPMEVKIYGTASTYEPGYLEYLYSFAYDNSLYDSSNPLGLSSSSVGVFTYVSPITVKPLSSSGFFTLDFSSVTSSTIPRFVDPNMVLYWTGLNSSSYVLNYTLNNTVFIVPTNMPVSFNLSNVFYNPVTGQSNYLNSTFYWAVNGVNASRGGSTYNDTINFGTTQVNTVTVNGTSVSGQRNSTTFTVYAYNGTPYANYSINFYGKQQYTGSYTSYSTQNITVPQLKTVSLNAYNDTNMLYNSSLLIPGTSYHVPLNYQWNFSNFTSLSPNTTYTFQTPTFGGTPGSGNLSVSGITGGSTVVHFNVVVNDTTPPSPLLRIFNETHVKNSTPNAGSPVYLDANKSTEPNNLAMNFSWRFFYSNLTQINASSAASSVIQVIAGSVNNSSWVEVRFNTLVNVVISLSAYNGYAYSWVNKTITLAVHSPRLVVDSVSVVNKLSQGSTGKLNVTVSNNGSAMSSNYTVQIWINSQVVASQSYNGASYELNVSQERNLTFDWKPAVRGNVTIQVEATQANNSSYPAFFAKYGGLTTYVNISPPSYTTPLIIVGIILVIVVIFVLYYRFSTRGIRGRAEKGGEAKPRIQLPGQGQKGLEQKKK